MTYISYAFALFASLILPIIVSLFLIVKKKQYFKVILVGVITFLIFQVFTRIYILQVILPSQVWYILFTYQYPILYVFLLSLSAGLFEEIGRYITMKYLLKSMTIKDAIVFGIGHGGIESILLVGVSLLMINPSTIPFQNFLMSGVERISAMILHCGFSVLVYQMLFRNKKYNLIYSIALHTLVNLVSVLLMMNNVNLWIIEGALFVSAGFIIMYIRYQWRNEYETISLNS